jgi:hypothetical protein
MEVDHPPRDTAVGQEVAGQDEEGHGHDFPLLDTREQLEGDRFDGNLGHRDDEGHHGEAQRDADRHAGQHQRQQQAEDDEGVH